ncbi:hypothetical protein F4703DRAFT_1922728 [Phycomyces blakesleeanus]
MKSVNICFFRNIFRVHDNMSLYHAIQSKPDTLLPLVCLDPRMMDLSALNGLLKTDFKPPTTWHYGIDRCSRFRTRFIIESILDLKNNLLKRKSDLLVLYGEPEKLLPELRDFLAKKGLTLGHIHTHKEYAYEELQTELALSKDFNITFHSDTTMIHPGDVNFTFDKTPRVFTPFRKRIEAMPRPVRALLEIPKELPQFPSSGHEFKSPSTLTSRSRSSSRSRSTPADNSDLESILNKICPPFEADSRSAYPFSGGETTALSRLDYYLFGTDRIAEYKQTRNGLIGTDYSTKFSAFLAHGCISPRLIWHEIDRYESISKKPKSETTSNGNTTNDDNSLGTYWVKFELLWRDYWRYLSAGFGNQIFYLHGFQSVEKLELLKKSPKETPNPASKKYTGVWLKDRETFQKWCQGTTGVPFIDAVMREMKLTGFASNRGRQNVASFLARDLYIDWRMGAEWFESYLTDHDVYSNYGNWQYVSGVGCDPRESIRHFNIIKQAKDYDPKGNYVKLWCPELKNVPTQKIHAPWIMTEEEQRRSGCVIGKDYPKPIIIVDAWKKHSLVKGGSKTNGNPSETIAGFFTNPKRKQRRL